MFWRRGWGRPACVWLRPWKLPGPARQQHAAYCTQTRCTRHRYPRMRCRCVLQANLNISCRALDPVVTGLWWILVLWPRRWRSRDWLCRGARVLRDGALDLPLQESMAAGCQVGALRPPGGGRPPRPWAERRPTHHPARPARRWAPPPLHLLAAGEAATGTGLSHHQRNWSAAAVSRPSQCGHPPCHTPLVAGGCLAAVRRHEGDDDVVHPGRRCRERALESQRLRHRPLIAMQMPPAGLCAVIEGAGWPGQPVCLARAMHTCP